MYANVSTWQLDPPIQGDDEYGRFIWGLLSQTLPLVRTLGLIDALIVRAGTDMIMAINLYEEANDAESAWIRTSA
jgi:hypothetical protein